MRDDVKRLLDGELDPEEARRVLAGLDPGARREAEAMARLAAAAERLERPAASPDFAARAMARVRARRPPRRSVLAWLRAPRVSPLGAFGGAAAAAALAAVLALRAGPPTPSPAAAPVLAQLRIDAPAARSVEVAGDFNGWRPEATPLRRTEGGTWTARVPVVPGRRYQYQFVVDGQWVTDPAAPATDDGFGGRNAVLDL